MVKGREPVSRIKAPKLDEQTNIVVQLFNILLEAVARDSAQFRRDVQETYDRLISTLATYVDFECLDPYTRYLLESNLMSDIILSHLEYLDEYDKEPSNKGDWLRLSGRTKALIAIALSRCSTKSSISYHKEIKALKPEGV